LGPAANTADLLVDHSHHHSDAAVLRGYDGSDRFRRHSSRGHHLRRGRRPPLLVHLGLVHGRGVPPQDRLSPAPPPAPDGERPPPKFYKLEFPTYDGSEDPLNWLSHCEQFFRGQRTLASDCTWLASYHLRGPAQTWYYTLEQSEGMPSWERFKELCHLQFGPPVRDSRLAELGRLLF
jgi:hypothetical protein